VEVFHQNKLSVKECPAGHPAPPGCARKPARRPGPGFEYNITRQLITPPGDEEDIWQLSLTLYFLPDSQNSQLGSGARWHQPPEHIDGFASYIDAHPATAYAATHRPAEADLRWGSV
jgi:hypothetical protein